MKLSVAICTRNPRREYLDQVLSALSKQTLSPSEWELLLIDSASDQPLPETMTLHLGLGIRVVRLEISGIMRARCAAIAEARAPLLLFLDDDNVPSAHYLERGLEIAAQWPQLGCWGPAIIAPLCESRPAADVAQELNRMACCDFPTDRWSNTLEVVPPTAGLFIRTELARDYVTFAEDDTRRQLLGSTSDRFFRGEDTDLVFFLVKKGWGAGQFRPLALDHLMPNQRLNEDYIVSLAKVAAGSALLVNYLWGVPPRRNSRLDEVVYWLKSLRFTGLPRRIAQAHRAGEAEARGLIATLTA
ncbi:glycosyltransferase [Oleiharenicola lentus]|uniref:glycosyltransferase n=1 Tax=Oleiharenicola lentus TaxID=2508720 RepID=UPI003F66A8F6